jgi:hypothetical protein
MSTRHHTPRKMKTDQTLPPEEKDADKLKPCGGRVPRLVRRARKLLDDLQEAGYVLSLVTGGGQPSAILQPEDTSLESDPLCASRPGVYDLGSDGVGEMISL